MLIFETKRLLLLCSKEGIVLQALFDTTLFSFVAGLFYSRFKSQIKPFVQQWYWIALPASILVFFSVHIQNYAFNGLKDNLTSILFALSIVAVSIK